MMVGDRPEAELERSSYIRLTVCSQQRNLPALILHIAGKAKARAREDICVESYVILSSPLRKEFLIYLPMPKL